MPNPPGRDLSALLLQTALPFMDPILLQAGYVQFGKGPDWDDDAVCLDLSSRTSAGDYRIVKIDHEEILCNNRIKAVAELASSFGELMGKTIEKAAKI